MFRSYCADLPDHGSLLLGRNPCQISSTKLRDLYRSGCLNHPRAMDVIHDPFNPLADHVEPDSGESRPGVRTPFENDHHGFTVHFTQGQFPRHRPPLVIEEIRCLGKLPGKPLGNVEPGVSANQFTHPVPIAAVEALDVELHDPFQLRARASSRHLSWRRISQLGSSAVECRLDAADGRIDQFRNLLQRIIEYVLQKHARPLFRRERQHKTFDSFSGSQNRLSWLYRFGHSDSRVGFVPHSPATEEIDTTVVSNPKQP